MKQAIVSIQYLRGLAALMVVYHHCVNKILELNPDALIPYSGFGNAGVDIFFVISGFIMWVTTVSKPQSPRRFWYRRIIRIVPLYWFFIFVIVITKRSMPGLLQSTQIDPLHIFNSLLFIPHFHPFESDQIWPILIPGWTLNYEMFFYFIFGASLFVPTRWRLAALTTTFLLLPLTGLLLAPGNALLITYTDKLLLEFLAGIFIGAFFVRGIALSPFFSTLSAATAIILLIVFETSILPGGPRLLNWGLPAVFLVMAALGLDKAGKIPRISFLQLLGDASFSIYLSHILSIEMVELCWQISGVRIDGLLSQLSFIILSFGISTFVGLAVFRFVERPLLQRLRPLSRQRYH